MRFHFSFHKCLTKFTGLCFNRALNNLALNRNGYKHFNSEMGQFVGAASGLKLASVNNHFLEPDFLEASFSGPTSISVFLRDPRDLLVSGYHYHRKGTEEWTRINAPTADDYRIVNGTVPNEVQRRECSLHSALNDVDVEAGLILELEFRKAHFDTMEKWLSSSDNRILFLDYEDIVGNEREAFLQLGRFHKLSFLERRGLQFFAERYKASKNHRNQHIRNPAPGQWKGVIPSGVLSEVRARHPRLIDLYESTRAAKA